MNNSTPIFVKSKFDLHLWWITALLIAINVGLFLWQVLVHGMDITSPTSLDALHWGADFAPLTFLQEPQRLLSSMFFHFGLIHLMLNMWALYIFGSIAEQMFGRLYFIGLYILAGLMGNLLSGYLAIQDSYEMLHLGQIQADLLPSVSAGASGAVMGLGASLTVLALLPALPHQRFLLDRKTLVIVMALNIAIGFSINGINNAAHIGGIIMGILLTLIWYTGETVNATKYFKLLGIILGITLCYFFYQYDLKLLTEIQPFWQELIQVMLVDK